MRLWHQSLISSLPRQQLLGQHREVAALRGNGWGRPHATVNYVFQYSPYKLYQFHLIVLNEMLRRGYHPNQTWFTAEYRGTSCPAYSQLQAVALTSPIYPEHNAAYLKECLDNLAAKGITL
ncbi:TIGR02328 family protein [Liquorilactobacillus satsumensis]|uniref:TIGR02328 family protein n=1 Tax=Liquorilactobacillus satsumensis TaxID=259059 RepID=UPI0021C4238C|nr:TIGR02328 family protein [Liquorilactobacillus satsumensis]MCP9312041.1 TIGR02328 family protein [Liquorilactobacillus satsumensis]MCP9329624.1 TIGR02328 family protein [Liquorilactobacillus satsumensis]MCP9359175.1 TIGR02328 family protein [Liquorilactobacillus satsumensis]